jgi:hypothetical protein
LDHWSLEGLVGISSETAATIKKRKICAIGLP